MLVNGKDAGTSRVKNSIIPRIKMPSQSLLGDMINKGRQTEVVSAAKIKLIQGNEDIGIFPELNVSEANGFAGLGLWCLPRSNFRCVDRGAEYMCSVLRIGNPSHPSGIKDGIIPRLDVERESFFVDAGCTSFQTSVPSLVKVDEVEKDDDFRRGNEWTLEVDTGGGRILRICSQAAGMLAVLKLQVGRSQIQ